MKLQKSVRYVGLDTRRPVESRVMGGRKVTKSLSLSFNRSRSSKEARVSESTGMALAENMTIKKNLPQTTNKIDGKIPIGRWFM